MDIQRDEAFEEAYSKICKPIIARPYPRNEKGEYFYKEIHEAHLMWQAAQAQTVPEWNSVDDKEPPLGIMVLICWSDALDVEPEKDYMDHDVDHGVNYWANYNDGDEPSHWMLLPKPVVQEQSHEHS